MSKGFAALVTTDSCDHYTWFYDEKPTRADIIKRLFEFERAADLDWYEETTTVEIKEHTVGSAVDPLP